MALRLYTNSLSIHMEPVGPIPTAAFANMEENN